MLVAKGTSPKNMIYTLTCNPSLDYFVTVDDFALGKTNRTKAEEMIPGGKGINVSIVLKNLEIDNASLGFVAGFVGKEICRRIEEYDIKRDFIELEEGCSRINVKIKNIDGTEINGAGPDIPNEAEAKEKLFAQLLKLKAGDILVLAGSIPASMPSNLYQQIMEKLKDKGVLFVVDASSTLLTNTLQYHPFLIKPNQQELGEIFHTTIKEKSEVLPYAKKLQDMGARNVLVSMGGKGAVFLAENGEVFESEALPGTVKNTVGAGDSMVAGFIAGYLQKRTYQAAFSMALAAGSASAFSDSLATKMEVMEQINNNKLLY